MDHQKKIALQVGPGSYKPDVNKVKSSPKGAVRWTKGRKSENIRSMIKIGPGSYDISKGEKCV